MLKLLPILALSLTAVAQTNPPVKPSPELFSSSMDSTLKAQIISDLEISNSLQFSKTSALHQAIFGKKPAYIKWFSSRIKHVSLGNCANVETAVACVIPLLTKESMRVTERYVKVNAPQIARMSILFHEAKHTEYNPREKETDPDLRFWLHVKCPAVFVDENNQPRMSIWTGAPLAGVEGCDITPVGAYGTVVIMLNNISRYSNASEKIKADAEIFAKDQLTRITDASAHEQLMNDE